MLAGARSGREPSSPDLAAPGPNPASHAAYGEALGITRPQAPAPEGPALLPLLGAVRAALAGYALQVAAWVDGDAAAVPDARRALAPFDAYRAAQARRSGADVPAPPEPIPPATPETAIPHPPA